MSLSNLPPAAASVECSDTTHQLLWRAGALHCAEHADPDAERALAALGGAPCRCIQLLDAWQAHARDPRVLVIGPRGPVLSPPAAQTRRGSMYVASVRSGGPNHLRTQAPPAATLEDLLGLGTGLGRRLVATVAQNLIDRGPDAAQQRLLYAALYGRLLVALARFLGRVPELDLRLISTAPAPRLECAVGQPVRVVLPLDWLVEVWGAGLEIVADHFILATTPQLDGGWSLRGVDAQMTETTWRLAPG